MLKAWGEVTGSLSDVLMHAAQIKVVAFWFWSLCFGHDVVSIQKQFLVSKMIKWGHVGNYKQLTVIGWQKLLIDSNWLQHSDKLSAFTNWTTVIYKPANLSESDCSQSESKCNCLETGCLEPGDHCMIVSGWMCCSRVLHVACGDQQCPNWTTSWSPQYLQSDCK